MDDKRGQRAMEWMRDNRGQQINSQPLMGVAKAGGDTAAKAKAALAGNGAFCCRVDHGSGGKVGIDGRAAVDIRQRNNQLKLTEANSGIDSCGGGGKQQQSTAISSKTQMAKLIVIVPPPPLLLLLAGSGGRAAAAAARE